MATCSVIETDAPLNVVVSVLRESGLLSGFAAAQSEKDTFYLVSFNGGRVTLAADLKFDVDELETWLAVYEQSDVGLQKRLFDYMSARISDRLVRYAADSTEALESNFG